MQPKIRVKDLLTLISNYPSFDFEINDTDTDYQYIIADWEKVKHEYGNYIVTTLDCYYIDNTSYLRLDVTAHD